MNKHLDACPSCSAEMEPGYLSAPTGVIQWSEQEPSLLAKLFQTGDVLTDMANPTQAHLKGFRCNRCRVILMSY